MFRNNLIEYSILSESSDGLRFTISIEVIIQNKNTIYFIVLTGNVVSYTLQTA